MRIKLYNAATMAEAIARVRAELGAEALILSTRRVTGGVEVTAALEPGPLAIDTAPIETAPYPLNQDPSTSGPTPPQPAGKVAFSRSLGPRAGQTHGGNTAREAAFAFHGVPASVGRRLSAGPLPFAVSAAFRFVRVPLAAGTPPLLVAGPPGAGKTLTVARLASRLVMNGAAPLVITADGTRAGATEQLAAFTRLLGIDLIVASTPKMLARALTRRVANAPVLIDAPGTDAFDEAQRRALCELSATAQATIALVLPAGLDPLEAAEVADTYRAHDDGVLLVANRLDGARRLGGILAAAGIGLALTEAGIGPGAADGLIPMTPEFLASRLMQFPDPHP
jgi:flagellar biosynthesis protein FlhF